MPQGTQSKASILHLYGLVIGAIVVCVILFSVLYGSGGASVLLAEQETARQAELTALPTPTPTPTPAPSKVSTAGRLFPYLENGIWGYKNTAGEIAITASYSAAEEFVDEVAFAAQNGIYGLIDRNGIWLVEPVWSSFLPFSEGRAAVCSGEKWGFIDKTGALIIDYKFREVGSFSCGRAMARTGSNYGYIDPLGNMAVSEKFRSAGPFEDDIAFASQGSSTYIINKAGSPQFTLDSGLSVVGYSEGVALVKYKSAYYYITKYGRKAFGDTDTNEYQDALMFAGGHAAVKLEGLWGFINSKGVASISPEFMAVDSFSDGMAAVQNESGLWAYIDTSGSLKTDYSYSIVQPFVDDYAVVKRGQDWLILSKSGEEVPIYSELA